MLIPILTACNEPDSVPPHVLDHMLVSGEVRAFERSTGWAMIGRDPIRSAKQPYPGFERRRSASIP